MNVQNSITQRPGQKLKFGLLKFDTGIMTKKYIDSWRLRRIKSRCLDLKFGFFQRLVPNIGFFGYVPTWKFQVSTLKSLNFNF